MLRTIVFPGIKKSRSLSQDFLPAGYLQVMGHTSLHPDAHPVGLITAAKKSPGMFFLRLTRADAPVTLSKKYYVPVPAR